MVLLHHVVAVVVMVGEPRLLLMLEACWPVVDQPVVGVKGHVEAVVVALVVAWKLLEGQG